MKAKDPDIKDLMVIFVSEAHDFLDLVDARLTAPEKGRETEYLNDIFRAFHSIKGSSGFVNLTNISRITHALETLLDRYRGSNAFPDEDARDLICGVNAFIRKLLEKSERDLSDEGFHEETESYVRLLTDAVDTFSHDAEDRPGDRERSTEDSGRLPDSGFFSENDQGILFAGESKKRLGTCMVDLLSAASPERLLDAVEALRLSLEAIRRNAGFVRAAGVETKASLLLEKLSPSTADASSYRPVPVPRIMEELESLLASLSAFGEERSASRSSRFAEAEFPAADGGRTHERRIGEILIEMGEVSRDSVSKALEIQESSRPLPSSPPAVQRQDIRIETSKLDSLLNLTGELNTAEAMVRYHRDLETLQSSGLIQAVAYLSKITRELQETAMSMRMIPLEGLFLRMNRVVRDLSRRMGKDVELCLSGGIPRWTAPSSRRLPIRSCTFSGTPSITDWNPRLSVRLRENPRRGGSTFRPGMKGTRSG